MPAPSAKTAWDFLPEGWSTSAVDPDTPLHAHAPGSDHIVFEQGDGSRRAVSFPADFEPITQLESARLGIVTDQMRRVAPGRGRKRRGRDDL